MTSYPRFKAAAVHVAPVYHDTERTVDKACDLIAEAGRARVRLIAFPEVLIPGFPIWAGVVPPTRTHDYFRKLASEAIEITEPEFVRITTTLIVHGDDDQIVPIDASARAAARLVPHAVLKVYPGAPHGLADTHKDQLNADLLTFLKS